MRAARVAHARIDGAAKDAVCRLTEAIAKISIRAWLRAAASSLRKNSALRGPRIFARAKRHSLKKIDQDPAGFDGVFCCPSRLR